MLIAGGILLMMGLFFLLAGIILFLIRKFTWIYTAQTTGQVIDMCMNAFDYNMGNSGNVSLGIRTGSSSPGVRCPIYSYYVNGQEYRKASRVGHNRSYIRKMMEKPITVYYNPENPEQSCLGKIGALGFTGIVLSSFGAVMLIVGIVLIIVGL